MPITIPPYSAYQAPLTPLRGLWNAKPKEGDRFANAEIDWSAATKGAVQFNLSGNSPIAFSQIVALYVDNSDCGSDVSFLFPDTGFSLSVPANEQSLFPVFTNALSFFAVASAATLGDRTVIQILNSVPPPIPLSPSSLVAAVAASGVNLAVVGTTTLLPAGISGTLKSLDATGWATGSGVSQSVTVQVIDGLGGVLWFGTMAAPGAATGNFEFTPAINARFQNGLSFKVITSTIVGGIGTINAYYTSP